MSRFIIRHVPSKMALYEDEGGLWLISVDACFTWKNKKDVEEVWEYLKDLYINPDGTIFTEDGDFPLTDFDIFEIN